MYFDSFAAFIDMGGHGKYVWAAYAYFVSTFWGLLKVTTLKRRKALKMTKQYLEREDARQQKPSGEPS